MLVTMPEGVPWQAAMMAALRGQAATWGGSANLPVPWTEELLERPELWALAESLDPDVVLLAMLRRSDLHGILPETSPRPAGGKTAEHADMPLPRPDPGSVLQAFARRLPILQRGGTGRLVNTSPAEGARFPFTPVSALERDLGPVVGLRCPADLDLGLLLAAESGDLDGGMAAALARRGVVADLHELDGEHALSRVLEGTATPGAQGAWALSETGLRWLTPVSRGEPVASVVVGDDPWDFAVAYALRRHGSLAWWVPSALAGDVIAVQRLAVRVRTLGRDASEGYVLSTSDGPATARLAGELQAHMGAHALTWRSDGDLLELLRRSPSRLLTDAGGLESFPVHDGQTGYLPPLLPTVREAFGQRGLYWMSEVMGDNWQPLPDARLAEQVVRWPCYDTTSCRPTRAGVAFLCTHFIRFGGEDLAAATVRPRVHVLDLSEQVSAVIAGEGWSLRPSDKGLYAEGCAGLLGGDQALLDAMVDPSFVAAIDALQKPTAPRGSPRGWVLNDGRIYFSLAELEAIRTDAGLAQTVDELLGRGVLLRGLVFRCPLCRCVGSRPGTAPTNWGSGSAAPGADDPSASQSRVGSRLPSLSGDIDWRRSSGSCWSTTVTYPCVPCARCSASEAATSATSRRCCTSTTCGRPTRIVRWSWTYVRSGVRSCGSGRRRSPTPWAAGRRRRRS